MSGIASRRQSENLILQGKAKVNGVVQKNVLTFVNDGDTIDINGQDISLWLKKQFVINEMKLWLYHKPKGVITSRIDERGRITLFSLLPKNLQNLLSVGRLDYNTEGLILLTNNGQLSRFFELPQNAIERVYKCRVFGVNMQEYDLNTIRNGITIDGINYGKIDIERESDKWFTMRLREGKNREIRKIFQYFGGDVSRLIRVQYGEFYLSDLMPNEIVEVSHSMLDKYKKKLMNI